MCRLATLIAVISLTYIGCSTFRYPNIVPPDGEPPASRPVIGIVEPLAHLNAEQPLQLYGELWPYESEADLKAAAHLIQLLRDTGLFEEVDFVCQLESVPNLALSAIAQSWPRDARETSELTFWSWMLTIGLVPWVET